VTVHYWNGTNTSQSSQVLYMRDDETLEQVTEIRGIPGGYTSVADMLSRRFYGAHRGGSLSFPEMSMYGYTQMANWGWGVLELSVARTKDYAMFGMHDDTFLRTSGVNAKSTDLLWADVEQLRITAGETINPAQTTRRYARAEDILRAYGGSHIIFLDPKYMINEPWLADELLDIALEYSPPEMLVGKYFGTGRGWSYMCRQRGIKTWGYFYDTGLSSLPTYAKDWDILGMNWDASQSAWDTILAYNKPVMGHICASTAAIDTAFTKGASGVMCSLMTSIPRSA
jgi:Glycerophosphoryl diester phosphodiesterase family